MPRVSATSPELDRHHENGGDLEITSSIDMCRICWSDCDQMTMMEFKDRNKHWSATRFLNHFSYWPLGNEPWKTGIIMTDNGNCDGEPHPDYEEESESGNPYCCEVCGEPLTSEDN
ncbi:MAG: hypothetical protein GOVbin2833_24 [Prokaryotic dsDNA virus sp.]|nr:MAG: hypothetical protein GOVbin2833_24 [Prokaryotic dsDNA virus sp.]|tara:strand:+ start:11995 stop:12342 length:348 start_codon:yes stop_codon:yes gene_type:complete